MRYNPHSIEKQAKKWVNLSLEGTPEKEPIDLISDIIYRQTQIWRKPSINLWLNPFCTKLKVSDAMLAEYGTDASRIAQVVAQNQEVTPNLLESAFKWLAELDACFSSATLKEFDTAMWLEAALLAEESITKKGYIHGALACLRKAKKHSPPNKSIDEYQRLLVLTAVYPFCPIYSRFKLAKEEWQLSNIPSIINHYRNEFACVRFSLKPGIWHWKVFAKRVFDSSPIEALKQLKWIKQSIGNKEVNLHETENGVEVCFL